MNDIIPFNIPYLSGKEKEYVTRAIDSKSWSGDGPFTKKCQVFFEEKFSFKKTFLTTSCTDALEMAAILCNIQEGDEVIMPSYTFVSTANAFILRGAKVVFVDSEIDTPNLDTSKIETLINPKTKAIVVMHYAGFACNMDSVMKVAEKHNLFVIEDAALALGSYYKQKPLGSFGHLATFSFHETKNISCGEGGLLVINDEKFIKRAEILREKGTDRGAFFRGEVAKYGWVDIGSSFLPSDILAAFLFAQLEKFDVIQDLRKKIWDNYYHGLKELEAKGYLQLPKLNDDCAHSSSVFYVVCKTLDERTKLSTYLKNNGIHAAFHYQALHQSSFYRAKKNISLPQSEKYSDCLLRLPLYPDLSTGNQIKIIEFIKSYYNHTVLKK